MNKFIIFLSFLLSVGLISCSPQKDDHSEHMEKKQVKDIYTCPMHPEVKQDKPGKCPICHMDLVKVKKKKSDGVTGHQHGGPSGGGRGTIEAGIEDLKLVGVQKHKVEKMSLNSELPVSGRFTSSTHIAFQIYERELGEIKVGNKFTGQAAAEPEITLEGKISSIDAYVDPISRTIRVIGVLDRSFSKARVESSFHGNVVVQIPDVIAIPEDAILHAGKDDLVYLFGSDETLKAHTVKLGVKVKGYYQVLSGLSEGDFITTGANFLLDSEAKIRGARD